MSATEHVRVALIGAGFAGIAASVALKRAGIDDFVVLERADEVGGVWRDNSYPGIACDVPSSFYSLSFAPNPDWSRTYSPGEQIATYTRGVVDEYGVRPHIRFGQELVSASWEDAQQHWVIKTPDLTFTADVLVDCAGSLAEPQVPSLPGLETFAGTVFHSARWDHGHDLRGKRVAVVGTGASAIQFVPAIQPVVDQLTVFQRTPVWVVPRNDRPTTAIERRLFTMFPSLQRLQRSSQFAVRELLHYPMIRRRKAARLVLEATARFHLRRQITDPALRAKLEPDFEIGCKRLLISNDWYPALAQDNVHVVANGVREIRESSVVAADGSEHEVDTIIFGTGFSLGTTDVFKRIHGRDGRSLDQVWQGSPRHYRAVSIAGFPNYFRLGGQGCGIGHGSMIFQIESQTAYLIDALDTMARRGLSSVEVTAEAQGAYLTKLSSDLEGTVWLKGGCSSWYQDASGDATGMWPRSLTSYRRLTRRFEPADHHLQPRGAASLRLSSSATSTASRRSPTGS
ncbi:MAG TPA: NAD(P)/FAD-dependent oxidoreductase [Nocardioidaceae bacterium]|nr:NAD(P)/FAD-dependent oxidoreductase [Nocardioidaceae bacterium]